ncbi:MAG: phospho-sugar mutase [Candidatus Eisenbacteria bacterium]|uniref:Phospho-sugar mutase n=1 Tax=Eiseniibacteriota bacterium TaxID=2212470 RepID=A0A7Y2E6N2_UNCEI|nr:phospho-sugar mutase [Candidatus Eisenbacteria bacterium]
MTHSDLISQAQHWLKEDPDPTTQAELQSLLDENATEELAERFGTRLEFGTAGLRGVIGAGPNRMNRALVRQVSRGLADYLLETLPDTKTRGVVVGYDGRRLSPEFAEDTAAVLNAAGIPVHVFSREVSTPLVAYGVTELEAAAGVMVTASHNPPEYNGYKVYWDNGAQIIPPHDKGISRAIDAVESISSVPLMESEKAREGGLLQTIAESLEQKYVDQVISLQRHPETSRDLTFVYTPLHGVGKEWVAKVFEQAGFKGLHVVSEQAEPDGEFPTVRFPNPEEPGALDLALDLAAKVDADAILANDPDADRLAVALKQPEGSYRVLTGNEIGTLLGHYLLQHSQTSNPLVSTTIVSSRLLQAMAKAKGAAYEETLTGFKWIANRAIERKSEGLDFIFGFEEALGYTVSELVRDKDGVGAALVFADLMAFCKHSQKTALEYLAEIYAEFGVYLSAQKSLTLPGSSGLAKIQNMMAQLRENPPVTVGEAKVVSIADLQSGEEKNIGSGEISKLSFPPSNVLRFRLDEGSQILARPSGTEPKIKFYVEVREDVEGNLDKARGRAKSRMDSLLESFSKFAESLAD